MHAGPLAAPYGGGGGSLFARAQFKVLGGEDDEEERAAAGGEHQRPCSSNSPNVDSDWAVRKKQF